MQPPGYYSTLCYVFDGSVFGQPFLGDWDVLDGLFARPNRITFLGECAGTF